MWLVTPDNCDGGPEFKSVISHIWNRPGFVLLSLFLCCATCFVPPVDCLLFFNYFCCFVCEDKRLMDEPPQLWDKCHNCFFVSFDSKACCTLHLCVEAGGGGGN